MPLDKDTFYERLGLPRDATLDEIRHAYREMARRLHPDKNLRPGETELFMGVQEAYEILSDPTQKTSYDNSLPAEPQELAPLVTSILYSRSNLAPMPEAQLVYALLEFKGRTGEGALPPPPFNICLVLDCSTSMQGIRLDTVKMTAIELIRQLRPNDILSVVQFSDKAEVLIPARSHFTQQEIINKIQFLRTSGGTEIYQGLQAGYTEVMRSYSKSRVNHIILITDGRTYGDENDCLRLVEQATVMGVGISALGIGGQWNDSFLDLVTSHTGGSSKFVSHTEDLRRFLLDKISRLGHSFCEQVTYTFQTIPGVELNYAFRIYPEISQLIPISPSIMGNVPRDSRLSLIMEFLVRDIPADSQQQMLAKGYLSYDVPGGVDQQRYSERLVLSRPVGPELDNTSPPMEIIQAMSRLTLYRMQERARLDLQNGDVSGATRRLQGLATHLLAQGENELARSVLSEIVHIEQTQTFSEEGEKRIKYGTRALLLPAGSEVMR